MNTPHSGGKSPAFNLALISAVVLFVELASIRWFPAHVLFLTFFTNAVLLASFVGMSIGCLAARRPQRLILHTPFWLSTGIFLGIVVELFRSRLESYVDVGNQKKGDVVYFGTETSALKTLEFTVPVELIAGLFFVLITLIHIGPGQEMGRAFNKVTNRTLAYSANLFGSLLGIFIFALFSMFELPPPVWFACVSIGVAWFMRMPGDNPNSKKAKWSYLFLISALVLSVWTSGWYQGPGRWAQTTWSPYYRIDHEYGTYLDEKGIEKERFVIKTNLIGHQEMIPVGTGGNAQYELPYLLQRGVNQTIAPNAWPAFKRVLIIGAGSGNDLSRVLAWCPELEQLDAVDIEPVIQRLGVKFHKNKPYADPRVKFHLNDGRNFLRQVQPGTYDLVIYALVDSLVLHSGFSNIRLESYLFTQEAFQDVQKTLKPTGVFAVYNFFRQGWLVARVRDELRDAFNGSVPVVFSFPQRNEIKLNELDPGFTLFFAGAPAITDALRNTFTVKPGNALWLPIGGDVLPTTKAGISTEAPPVENGIKWGKLTPSRVPDSEGLLKATDDWPFLYVRTPSVPDQTWRGVAVMVFLSAAIWFAHRPRASEYSTLPSEQTNATETGILVRSFFLGAGFMLIETKAVVHMALLFGGTWTVNTVVFGAVLVMSLIGNLVAGMLKPKNLVPWYVGLFVALACNVAVPPDVFLGMGRTMMVVGACVLAFAPVAFAGIIFATTFGRAKNPDRVFGANVAGALLGGIAENASMVLGFRLLGLVAVAFYLASALGNSKANAASPKAV